MFAAAPMQNHDQLGTHVPGAGFVTGIPVPRKHPQQTPMMQPAGRNVPSTAAPDSFQTDATTAVRVQALEQNMHQWIAQGDIVFLLNPERHSQDGAHITMPIWMINYYLEMAHKQNVGAYRKDAMEALGLDLVTTDGIMDTAMLNLKRKREELERSIVGMMPLEIQDVVQNIVPLGVVRGELDWGDAWASRMAAMKRATPGLVARELTISHLGTATVGDLWSRGRQIQNGTVIGFRIKKTANQYARFYGAQGDVLDSAKTDGAFLQFVPDACTEDLSNCCTYNSAANEKNGLPKDTDLCFFSYQKTHRLVSYAEKPDGTIDFSDRQQMNPAQRRAATLKINTFEVGLFLPLGRVVKCIGKTPSEVECNDGMRTKRGYEALLAKYPLQIDVNFTYRHVY
jgi:hypothetical protein